MRPLIVLLALLGLAACGSMPEVPGAGGASAANGADGAVTPISPMVAYGPGIGGAENSRLSYDRSEQGSQAAPQLVLNLQPGEGTTVAAAYPLLSSINIIFIPTMANSQRDGTLSGEQLKKLGEVVKEAGAALKAARSEGKSVLQDVAGASGPE